MFIRFLTLFFLLFTVQASALEVNGELKNAVVEKFSSDPVTGLVEGRIYYNTTTKTTRVYSGSAWVNAADVSSTQTLTNKTINGNNNTLNVLAPTQLEGFVPIANGGTGQASKAAAYDALSPNGSQGDLTYRGVSSNVALPVGANGQVLTVASGYPSWADSTGGAGSGEKNYVTNPSAATAITGWTCVGDLAVVRTTTAADLPRENTTPSGIKITADADTQSVADYCYFDFTLDDIDLNRKLNVKFGTKQTGSYVANDLAVVITTQADRTTAIATPSVTNIAAADYDFNGNGFDTTSTTTLSLVIRATADMATSAGVTISDVVVGPGTIISAAPIGPWLSYTPTGTWTTNTTYTGQYRRVGDTAEFDIQVILAGAPTAATLEVNLPSGLTLDLAKMGNPGTFGTVVVYDDAGGSGASRIMGYVGRPASGSTSLRLYALDDLAATDHYTREINATTPITFANLDRVIAKFSVPISEWAGAPNYAGANDVNYYATGGTWDAASSTTIYGPAGAAIPGALTAARQKTITPSRPVQETDFLSLEMKVDNGKWTNINQFGYGLVKQVTALYGANMYVNSSGQIIVDFYLYRAPSTGTYGSAGENWASGVSWRVVHGTSNAAVGFGAATTTSSGLVSTGTQSFSGEKTFTGSVIRSGDTAISAHDLADQTITESGATLNFGTEQLDTLGEFTSNTFTATKDGNYRIVVTGSLIKNSGTSTIDTFQVRINRSGSLIGTNPQISANVTVYVPYSATILTALTVGQTITVSLHPNFGGGRTFSGSSRGAAITIERI